MTGSFQSGRRRTVNAGTVEAASRLQMRVLKVLGFLVPGGKCSGVISWTNHGREAGSIHLAVDLRDKQNLHALLTYDYTGEPKTQRVNVEAAPCPLGGERYYFRCPVSDRRCLVLAAVDGVFACRQVHRLTYRSQSIGKLDRLHDARDTAYDRAHGKGGYPVPIGAQRRRLRQRWMDAEEAYNSMFASEAIRRFGFEI